MKKFWVVLLSLGFVMAFSVSAFAVSADFTGEYYANGRYYDSPTLLDQGSTLKTRTGANSFSNWDQRFRLFSRFEIVKGLSITTRADIMETHWGQDTKVAAANFFGFGSANRGWTTTENNSINVEQTYISFSAPIIGSWAVGYKSARPFGWGTAFMNSTGTNPGIEWSYNIGPARVFFDYYKVSKGNLGLAGSAMYSADLAKGTDVDNDLYDLGVMYRAKAIDTGFMVSYIRDASGRGGSAATTAASNGVYFNPTTGATAQFASAGAAAAAGFIYRINAPTAIAGASSGQLVTAAALQPYFKGTFGPVALEAEGYWFTGKVKADPTVAAPIGFPDVDIDAKGLMLNAKFNIGPAYVGGIFMYNSGDKLDTADKAEGSVNSALGGFNRDKGNGYWGDFLTIIQGYHYHDHIPRAGDATTFDYGSVIDNIWLYQIYGGMDITKKLSFQARFSLAKADQDGAAVGWQSKDYGRELDFLVSYKIFDQLTYNVGAAYLWTGDWYKGTNANAPIVNAYYLLHQIDLNF